METGRVTSEGAQMRAWGQEWAGLTDTESKNSGGRRRGNLEPGGELFGMSG